MMMKKNMNAPHKVLARMALWPVYQILRGALVGVAFLGWGKWVARELRENTR